MKRELRKMYLKEKKGTDKKTAEPKKPEKKQQRKKPLPVLKVLKKPMNPKPEKKVQNN